MSAFRKLSIKATLGSNLLITAMLVSGNATANDFTAEKIMKEMKPEEQFAFVSGVVEGLAVARYHKDGKRKDGMNCIYDWFYRENESKKLIMDAFDRYPAYPPGTIIDVLVKRKCGE